MSISEDSASVAADSVSEDSITDYSDSETPSLEADRIRVTFLHRTASDFFEESEQGRNFLCIETSPDHVSLAWAKVLVFKARILEQLCARRQKLRGAIKDAITALSDAECETGVAQMAVSGYLERVIKTSGWAYEEWELWYQFYAFYQKNVIFRSKCNQVEEEDLSDPASEYADDYLAFAASYGLKFYVEQRLKSLPASLHSDTASYLLYRVTKSYDAEREDPMLYLRLIDLIGSLLRYGGNPNAPLSQSTIWGYFLAWMLNVKQTVRDSGVKDVWNSTENSWRTAIHYFVKHGAHTCGILTCAARGSAFDIRDHDLYQLSMTAKPETRCNYSFRVEMSVPTLIGYCFGDLPASAFISSNGALPYARCTEICIRFLEQQEQEPKVYQVWTLSAQQSDRLLKAYERYIVPTEKPPRSIDFELDYQVLLVYSELSVREPDRVSDRNGSS